MHFSVWMKTLQCRSAVQNRGAGSTVILYFGALSDFMTTLPRRSARCCRPNHPTPMGPSTPTTTHLLCNYCHYHCYHYQHYYNATYHYSNRVKIMFQISNPQQHTPAVSAIDPSTSIQSWLSAWSCYHYPMLSST